MKRSDCPIAAALDILGDRWTLVVLRDILLVHRYAASEIAADEAIATNIRNDRLERLIGAGIVARHSDPADGRRRNFLPTERAIGLIPVLVDLLVWGVANTDVKPPSEVMGVYKAVLKDRDATIRNIEAGVRKSISRFHR